MAFVFRYLTPYSLVDIYGLPEQADISSEWRHSLLQNVANIRPQGILRKPRCLKYTRQWCELLGREGGCDFY
jgi:hypothetical protein